MSAPVMLPLATPRLLRELVEGLPTPPARRKGRIEVAKLEAGFTLLRAGVPPEDEARLLLEVASDLVALARPIFEMPALTRVMLASAGEMIADDMLVKGTQTMASVIALRSAGYTGPIEAYFVHQTIAPNPVPLQRLLWLVHRIEWMEGDRLATRSEIGRWRDIDRPTS